MNDPKLLAYLAGVVDALGCIRLHHGKPALIVNKSEFSAPHLFSRSLGGNVVNGRFILRGEEALRAARILRPYMLQGDKTDELLQWKAPPPPLPVKKIVPKVPCPKGCGRKMAATSKMCWQCYAASQTKPAKSKIETTARGDGYVEQTPTGRIHRMMG